MALAFVVALLAGLSTVIGGWLGTRTGVLRRDVLAAALAFAAGLMITISMVEIAPAAPLPVAEAVPAPSGLIEIELPDGGRVRLSGALDPATVTAALRALFGR